MHSSFFTTILLSITVPLVSGLGINCRGSGLCPVSGGTLDGVISKAAAIDKSKTWQPGQQIVCDNHLCAFTQSTTTNIDFATIQSKLQDLKNHGCKGCGSVPLLPGNDVSTGQLTVNYASDAIIPGSGKCDKLGPAPACPGASCYTFGTAKYACYLACCQGPTPITNPLSCASAPEQCSCANSCGCCV